MESKAEPVSKLQCVQSNPVRSVEQAEEEEGCERFRQSIPWTAALGQTLGLTGQPRSVGPSAPAMKVGGQGCERVAVT